MSRYPTITPLIYDSIYTRKLQNNILKRLDGEAVGNEIARFETTGVLTEGEAESYRDLLKKLLATFEDDNAEKKFLDLGCGFGVLGRWIAGQIGLKLVGIDFSEVAVKQARMLAALDGDYDSSFKVADFSATELNSQSINVVFSLDSLYLAVDPRSALTEINRILFPKGLLLFTLYENSSKRFSHPYVSVGAWITLLNETGFRVIHCNDVSVKWQNQMNKKHSLRWREREKILSELGQAGENELKVSASMLGIHNQTPFIKVTSRYEILAVLDADK